MLRIIALKCDHSVNPLGVDNQNPSFSWMLESDQKGILQQSYSIEVAAECGFSKTIWASGKVNSDQSVFVRYQGPALTPMTRYYYRVRVTDNKGEDSGWSQPAFFETGLMNPENWQAEFITQPNKQDEQQYSAASPMLRKAFRCKEGIVCARVYATALGLYEIKINGRRVGDYYLTPGWTDYNKHLQYQTYDVTEYLQSGENVMGAQLGNGWYKGYLAGWLDENKEKYGSRTALLAMLRVEYADGSVQVVGTDSDFKVSDGPITMSELYNGESYDGTREPDGWSLPGFDDSRWQGAEKLSFDKKKIISQINTPVVKNENIRPKRIFKTPKGETLLDMDQNMVGWVRVTIKGERGSRVVLRHAEILDKDGNFYTDNLRSAKQRAEYVLQGTGENELFEPHFTFMGFQYICVDEFPGEPTIENFEGVVLHSGLEQTGEFSCSNDLVNQLQHNILWGQKGNYVDIPTDCPQRDERLGWTGDCQVFVRTACFNMDVLSFFKKWLLTLKDDQLANGGVPHVIPQVLKPDDHSATGWADAAVICPWTIYLCYGDKSILEEQYESMTAWVEYIRSHAQGGLIWNSGFHFGDWLALDAKEGSYLGATPNDLVATAFYAYSAGLLAKTAGILGKDEDQKNYSLLHDDIVKAFREEFYTSTGRLASHTQTAHVLALIFGLTDEKDRQRTAATLVKYLEENNWHLTTGFLGTPYLCHALSRAGYLKEAYKLLLQTDYPSWLYPVTKGATTMWEHWDGLKPDGSFWSPDMNSFNHYAYGAIGDWLYQVAAGIDIDEERPGYKHIIFRPQPSEKLQWVKASYQSLYGKIALSWSLDEQGILVIEAVVPPNTTATLYLPGNDKEPVELGSGQHTFNIRLSK